MSRPEKKRGFRQGIYSQSSTAEERLGTLRTLMDGRKFRYAKAGTSALSQGKMGTVPALDTDLEDTAQTSYGASAGDYVIQVVVGSLSTAVVANEYAGGYLMVNDEDVEGTIHEIESNEAAAVSATLVNVTLVEPLKAAIAATAEVTLVRSPWYGVVETGVEENVPAGVPLIDVTASYYYWAQTGGVANVLMSGTPAKGANLVLATPAGSVAACSATNEFHTKGYVGDKLFSAGVDTEYRPVNLRID